VIVWFFRNRQTGQITIAQVPNAALGLFLAAKGADWLISPTGTLRSALGLLATGALVWWALDELLRGVNPWRRFLGGAVLTAQIIKSVSS
jgi:hypothetical protein